ncbi:MAG: thiosulfate/3-mercaptopyruvate sulfurtransferase, partial [Planctomycetota bacterium]
MFNTLISVNELLRHKDPENWVIIDCRYDLGDLSSGYESYLKSHIEGAIYADIHKDLSGEPVTDSGRHPLPSADKLRRVFSIFGIDEGRQIVVYDSSSGAFAARLWWLLRFMGHNEVALLDGGWQAWQSTHQAVEAGERMPAPRSFEGEPRMEWLSRIEDIAGARLLVDSREGQRYRGEIEPIDPVAGHIPGAINRCWKENLNESGFFRDSAKLRQQFKQIFAETPASEVVFYCGSGVTACHNLLAVEHA